MLEQSIYVLRPELGLPLRLPLGSRRTESLIRYSARGACRHPIGRRSPHGRAPGERRGTRRHRLRLPPAVRTGRQTDQPSLYRAASIPSENRRHAFSLLSSLLALSFSPSLFLFFLSLNPLSLSLSPPTFSHYLFTPSLSMPFHLNFFLCPFLFIYLSSHTYLASLFSL